MVEAAGVYAALGHKGAAAFRSPPQALPNMPVRPAGVMHAWRRNTPGCGAPSAPPRRLPQVYEWRQYQLHPGYGSVPKLLAAFADG